MQSKLIKPWGPYAVGTDVVDSKTEAAEIPGALRVNPARFGKLQESGHLAPSEPVRQIPSEVRTSSGASRLIGRPLDDDGAVELSRRPTAAPLGIETPKTPPPAIAPTGQGDPEKKEP